MKRSAVLAVRLIFVAAVLSSGCAYFNTFYNAKKAFNEGEQAGKEIDPRNQPTSVQRSKYNFAINKCELLLEEFPNSGLVDDALFLTGKAHYRLRNYRAALRSFDNVLANFSGSDVEEEVLFLKALAHLELGEDQLSLDGFRRLQETHPDSKFIENALYQTGDSFSRRQRHEQAADVYRTFLTSYPKHRERQRVILEAAQAYIELEQYARADTVLVMLDSKKATDQQSFDGEFLRVQVLKELDRAGESLPILSELADQADRYDRRGEVLVLQGEVQLALGSEEEGLAVLKRAADEFRASAVEPQARLAIAEYLLKARGPDEDEVVDQLQTALDNRGGGDFMSRVQARRQQMARYRQLRNKLGKEGASIGDLSFQMGELLLTELDLPAAAVPHYRRVVTEESDGALAPRAAYALGYIHQELLSQPDSAAVVYAMLRQDYSESPQAQALDGAVFLEARVRRVPPPQEGAEAAEGGDEIARGDAPEPGIAVRPAVDSDREIARRDRRPLRRGGPGATTPRRRF